MNTPQPGRSALPPSDPNRRQGILAGLHIDLPLLAGLLLLYGFGILVLYSAAGGNIAQVERQLVRIGIALIVMVVIAQLPPWRLRRWSPWLYAAAVLMLIAVL
ncbi:MAG TPA: rod shape-determining protein RodA, partial [Chromatiaceae bacterium]|nr:rod shape-determining protein RodA [Chromatiaceae bacterium]